MKLKGLVALILTIPLVIPARAFAALAAGEPGLTTVYKGSIRATPDTAEEVRFSVEVERIQFLLSSVRERYKLIRLRVENGSRQPLRLSREKDRIEARLDGDRSVSGVLNPQRADSAFWDALDGDMRRALAYPEQIEPGRAPGPSDPVRPEIVYLYLFFPDEAFTTLPESFSYTLDSLSRTIEIRQPPPTAARR